MSTIQWIDVDADLPKVGEYVLVLEDDNLNAHDLSTGKMFDRIYPDRPNKYNPQRVKFAQLRFVEDQEEGYHRVPYWQQWTTPNGSPMGSPRNVTYWARFPYFPKDLVEPENEDWNIHGCENHRFRQPKGLTFKVCRICGLKSQSPKT